MLGVKNLRVLAAGLCLSVTLTACGGGNKETVNPNELIIGGVSEDVILNYESEVPTGTFSYDNMDEYIKIVKLKQGDISFYHLIIKDILKYTGGLRSATVPYDNIRYIDLKTGVIIINYVDYPETYTHREDYFIIGENIEVIDEFSITNYLLQEDFIKREYESQEILAFFEEKIKPTLESSEKELVK